MAAVREDRLREGQRIDAAYIEPVTIFGFTLAEQRVLNLVVCILVFVGLELTVTYSRWGKATRAVSQNIEGCAVVGIDAKQVVLMTFLLGSALAALSRLRGNVKRVYVRAKR